MSPVRETDQVIAGFHSYAVYSTTTYKIDEWLLNWVSCHLAWSPARVLVNWEPILTLPILTGGRRNLGKG